MWRRRLRFGIAAFGIGVAAMVVYAMRPRETRAPVAPVERIDPAATVETRGGDVIQLKGATEDLRVEFAEQATYSDGQTRLTGVKLMVDNRAGRNFVVTGNEARVGSNPVTYAMSGDVRLTASDGLTATAGSASYAEVEGIVRVPGPVQFSRGQMSGTGVGFTYDEQRNTVWLLDRAVVRFAGDASNGPMDVTSGVAGFARTERYLRFERGVRMTRSGQVIEAGEATVFLFADRDEPDRIELRGGSHVTGGTGLGTLRAMRARDINLDYADDGRTLERATLSGQSAIDMANRDGSPGQQLSGEWIDVALAADGSVTSLSGRERVVVSLPAAGDTPPRSIRAVQVSGIGAAGQGLTAMAFQDDVEFREREGQGRPARVARARALEARLAPGTSALEEGRFTGGFRFDEGALHAESAEARYRIVAGTLTLSGREGATQPSVSDEAVRIDADAIAVTLSPRRIEASRGVKTTLQPPAAGAGSGAVRRPALLAASEPVIVVSDRMSFDEQAHRGVYEGQARLFQGETTILAEAITMDEAKGDLEAGGKVRTTLALAPEAGTPQPAPSIVVASTFHYGDQSRRAVYTAAPPDPQVHMNGDQGDLTADRLELVLVAGRNALERLQATGRVVAVVGARTARGNELQYQVADERYVIVGAPVRFVDDCNESAGKTLTFFRASDRVIIDGNEEVRTQTRGGTCKK